MAFLTRCFLSSFSSRVLQGLLRGLSIHPHRWGCLCYNEQGPTVGAFTGGFFEHREWPIRRGLEKYISLRPGEEICEVIRFVLEYGPVFEYEANYINAAGYWMSFHEAAISLRQEALQEKKDSDAEYFDAWALASIRYGLRVVGLRTEFYKMTSRDPTYAKLVMPSLELHNDVTAADDLSKPLEKLDGHMATQLMKAVATLSASNAMKRAGRVSAAAEK